MKRKVDKKRKNPAVKTSGYFDMYSRSKNRKQPAPDSSARTNKLRVKLSDLVLVKNECQ